MPAQSVEPGRRSERTKRCSACACAERRLAVDDHPGGCQIDLIDTNRPITENERAAEALSATVSSISMFRPRFESHVLKHTSQNLSPRRRLRL